jgi:pullulanase/glycogen debranching enzyme
MKKLFFIPFLICVFFAHAQKKNESMHDWAKRSNVYEVNVRQFSTAGTFSKVQEAVPRLSNMGVEIIWLMPIHPIGLKGRKQSENDLGSYYSVQNYRGINPEFGNESDFKSLVKHYGYNVVLHPFYSTQEVGGYESVFSDAGSAFIPISSFLGQKIDMPNI